MAINKTKVVAISLVIVSILLLGLLGLRADFLNNFTNPLGQKLHNIGAQVDSAFSELRYLGSLNSDLADAREEVKQLQQRLIDQRLLSEENQQLREELGFIRDSELTLLPADVINYHYDQTRQMMRINVGENDGVETGMSVVSRGVLVGAIDQVSSKYSLVVLVNDINFRALVDIADVDGILRGHPGGGLVVDRLPQNHNLSRGDIVATSGQDGVHPRGILIGSINTIEASETDVFDSASINYALANERLRAVLVVIP